MKKNFIGSLLGIFLISLTLNANATVAEDICSGDLILNGGFEAIDGEEDPREGLMFGITLAELGSSNKKWDVYNDLPDEDFGDDVSWYTDDDTAGIEIQYDGLVVDAHGGVHYVELDSHQNETNGTTTNSAMSQDLDLEAGDYLIQFYYRPRTDTEEDNIIEVIFDDDTTIVTKNEFVDDGWELVEAIIPGVEAGDHKVTFRAAGIQNTLGGFIDDVSLFRICDEEIPDDEDDDDFDDEGDDLKIESLPGAGDSSHTITDDFQDTTLTPLIFEGSGAGCSLVSQTSGNLGWISWVLMAFGINFFKKFSYRK